ncbi:MAG: polyprenol monophosphomannose synthase [Anaerolineae bacterium]|nr:polyprenol monophosphomannose synthase [Anaerolineae bacterium]NUQ02962.1 polyprenol monophosphomannose synthase [Anaerolineae bacterium]
MNDVMVVLPTYNEAENLPLMLDALLNLPEVALRVLVVDDNSPDGTGRIADEAAQRNPQRVAVLHRTEKNGLGPAYIAGFRRAIELGAQYIIQMDADFSHQPSYIPQLIAKLESGYDLVIGSRFVQGGGVDKTWSFFRKLLSWFANGVYVRLLLGIPISDSTAGYRIWRRETLIGMGLERISANGYVFQVEMAYVAQRLGYRLTEIPIYFPDRERGKSKMGSHIIFEAAVRVWQLLLRHHGLTPSQRKPLS